MARYRCFLLGLPRSYCPTTPGMLKVFLARAATLRKGLRRRHLRRAQCEPPWGAYLRPDHSLPTGSLESFERSFSTAFFIKVFLNGDAAQAAEMGVTMSTGRQGGVATVAPLISAAADGRAAEQGPPLPRLVTTPP